MSTLKERLDAVRGNLPTRNSHRQIVLDQVERIIGKPFSDVTAQELKSIVFNRSRIQRGIHIKLVHQKEDDELRVNGLLEFEATYDKWVTAGKPTNWLIKSHLGSIALVEGRV